MKKISKPELCEGKKKGASQTNEQPFAFSACRRMRGRQLRYLPVPVAVGKI